MGTLQLSRVLESTISNNNTNLEEEYCCIIHRYQEQEGEAQPLARQHQPKAAVTAGGSEAVKAGGAHAALKKL